MDPPPGHHFGRGTVQGSVAGVPVNLRLKGARGGFGGTSTLAIVGMFMVTDLACVEGLQPRFEHLDHHVIPRCRWRHNGHVEALAALRDSSALLGLWTAGLACRATHQDPPARLRHDDQSASEAHVADDVTAAVMPPWPPPPENQPDGRQPTKAGEPAGPSASPWS